MSKKLAIIGGNGFIGKNFTEFFAAHLDAVKVIDRNIDSKLSLPNVESIAVDIHHTQELINVLADVDCVIWLVHASVPSTQDDSLVDDFSLNVSPIIKFLEKARHISALKRFVYFSSGGTVYGDTKIHSPLEEMHLQNPISNYGLSKTVAEKYIEYLTLESDFESIILRPSNVFGKYQNLVKPQGVIGFAFKAIYDRKPLDLYDGGRVIRDFVYVLDVAGALLKCMDLPLINGLTRHYNIGSNEGRSIKEILEMIENISGEQLMINHKVSRKFDCSYNVLETKKAKDELGWVANTTIEEGLLEVWEWIKISNEK